VDDSNALAFNGQGGLAQYTAFDAASILRRSGLLLELRGCRLSFGREFVRHVVLEDVTHVRRSLDADLLDHNRLGVVEPLVRVESTP